MRRVRLFHWNAQEARERAAQLKAAGYAVEHKLPIAPGDLRELREKPPDAIVIDLTRLPSHGRDVALVLREQKSTRHIPLVFVGGAPEKVERVRQSLPDAAFTDWNRFRRALKQAIARPPANPVVPKSRLDGYSGTPLVKKLGIKPGFRVALVGAPADFRKTLGELPAGVQFPKSGAADLTLWFLRAQAELRGGIRKMAKQIGDTPMWMIWPKKTSGVATDLNEKMIRETGLAAGLVDYKICAVDATWSGLLFRRRKAL
jgi:CheY-like chemotaxis protein